MIRQWDDEGVSPGYSTSYNNKDLQAPQSRPSFCTFLSSATSFALTTEGLPQCVVIDEIPFSLANSRSEHYQSQSQSDHATLELLLSLAWSSRCKVVIMVEDSRASFGSPHAHLYKRLLECSGFSHLKLNPVAPTFVVKALRRVCERERLSRISETAIVAAAEMAGGDLRKAVATLQMYSVGRREDGEDAGGPLAGISVGGKRKRGSAAGVAKGKGKGKLGKGVDDGGKGRAVVGKMVGGGDGSGSSSDSSSSLSDGARREKRSSSGSRHVNLSLFRVLGKALYGKRKPGNGGDPAAAAVAFSQRPAPDRLGERPVASLSALPSRGKLAFRPEDVLRRGGFEADPQGLSAFLHQNMADFFCDVDDYCCALDGLCDSDLLAAPFPPTPTSLECAGLVSLRAVALHNRHPNPTRTKAFQAFTRPAGAATRTAMNENRASLLDLRMGEQFAGLGLGLLSSEVLPGIAMVARAIPRSNYVSLEPNARPTALDLARKLSRFKSGVGALGIFREGDVVLGEDTAPMMEEEGGGAEQQVSFQQGSAAPLPATAATKGWYIPMDDDIEED